MRPQQDKPEPYGVRENLPLLVFVLRCYFARFLPFPRKGGGRESPGMPGLIAFFGLLLAASKSPAWTLYFPAWLALLIAYGLLRDPRQMSLHPGWPWAGDFPARLTFLPGETPLQREKSGRLAERLISLLVGNYLRDVDRSLGKFAGGPGRPVHPLRPHGPGGAAAPQRSPRCPDRSRDRPRHGQGSVLSPHNLGVASMSDERKGPGERFLAWREGNFANSPSLDGELFAMFREAVKDVRQTVNESSFGKGEHAPEMGTPMNPTPQNVTRDLGNFHGYDPADSYRPAAVPDAREQGLGR